MGVRDALRMVDSFNKWSKRNPGRAKDLEDFIHDGLIAAAKRCESCLREEMGISFVPEDDEEEVVLEEIPDIDDEVVLEKAPEHDEEEDDDDDDKPESSFEEPIRHVESEPFAPPSEDSDETSITLDHVERRDDEEMEDLSIEGPPREFSTDFELVEPTPLVVDEEGTVSEPISEPEPEKEEVVSEPPEEEEVVSTPESEELPDRPAFTWSEYEEAVTPSSEPEPLDPEVDIIPPEDEPVITEEPEEVSEEPPEPPKVWSPYGESSVVEDEDTVEEDEPEVDVSEPMEEGEDEPVISEPPAPPPPPESEEDEEERKRRARRLFFGA